MKAYTIAWLVWLVAFFAIEWAAFIHGGYAATATGHLVAVMKAHPIAFITIPCVFVAIALHLVVDGLRS